MAFRSLLFGVRPSVLAWAGVFFGLLAAVLAGYAQLSAAPVLPTGPGGYAALAGEFAVRALVLAEAARMLLIIYRDGDVSWLIKLSTGAALCSLAAVMAGTTFRPGPYSVLLSAVSAGAWLLAHTFINRRLAQIEQMEQQVQVMDAIGTGPRPEWLRQLGKELSQDPNYRDQH